MNQRRAWSRFALLAVVVCAGCCAAPKRDHQLLAKLRVLGADLPVRRIALIEVCGLNNTSSERFPLGLRNGWGGTVEKWLFPDGSTLTGHHYVFVGSVLISVGTLDDLLSSDPGLPLPFKSGVPDVPPTIWFNALTLEDRDHRILYSSANCQKYATP
jgi:hypothetical protein